MFSNLFDRDILYPDARESSVHYRETSLKDGDVLDTCRFCMKKKTGVAMANLFDPMAIIRENKSAPNVSEFLLRLSTIDVKAYGRRTLQISKLG